MEIFALRTFSYVYTKKKKTCLCPSLVLRPVQTKNEGWSMKNFVFFLYDTRNEKDDSFLRKTDTNSINKHFWHPFIVHTCVHMDTHTHTNTDDPFNNLILVCWFPFPFFMTINHFLYLRSSFQDKWVRVYLCKNWAGLL